MDILSWIKLNPSVITGAVMALVNMLVAFGVNLTSTQAAAIGTITTAVLTVVVAATTRPVGLQLIVGAVTTAVGALAAFHFALSPNQISTGATVLSLVLAVVFHFAHVPASAFSKGTTAEALAFRNSTSRPAAGARRVTQ